MILFRERRTKGARACIFVLVALTLPALPCELCSIYNAFGNAYDPIKEKSGSVLLSVSELFVPFRTEQLKGEEVKSGNPDHLDTSITHLVPTYNFAKSFGVSLNIPIVYRDFQRKFVVVGANRQLRIVTDEGTEAGLGDVALIGRWTAFRRNEMEWSVLFNVLAGVKFPTGDSDPLHDEAEQVRRYNTYVGPGHVHDALGIPVSGVHARDIALGSGSFDGIFGTTLNLRYGRWFFNNQIQYYLRTEGESTYEYGNDFMVSGGPGAYLITSDSATLSLQLNVAYENTPRDELFGQESDHTGMTSWYAGPLVNFTWGEHFSANIGVDVPLQIENNGFQNVPDYRIHGGLTWRF